MIPDEEAALMFILFFGYYPLLRSILSKITPGGLRFAVKLVLYNVFLLADYLLTVYVLGLPTFADTVPWMYAALLVGANLLFLMYDALLSRIGYFYRNYFVRRVRRK